MSVLEETFIPDLIKFGQSFSYSNYDPRSPINKFTYVDTIKLARFGYQEIF